jgi:hypothetical protein
MAATNEGKLYSAALLSLATELAAYPYSDTSAFKASERSRTCGSTIDVSIEIDSKNHVTTIGLRVAACAVGQASVVKANYQTGLALRRSHLLAIMLADMKHCCCRGRRQVQRFASGQLPARAAQIKGEKRHNE